MEHTVDAAPRPRSRRPGSLHLRSQPLGTAPRCATSTTPHNVTPKHATFDHMHSPLAHCHTHNRALHRSRTTTVATEHSHQHFTMFTHDAFFCSRLSPNTVIPQRSSQLFTGTKNTHTPHPPAPTPLVPQPRTTTCVETYRHSNVVRGPVCCDQRIDDGGAAVP